MKEGIFPFDTIFSFYRTALLHRGEYGSRSIHYLKGKGDLLDFAEAMVLLKKLNVLECLGDIRKAMEISKKGLAFAKRVNDVNIRSTFLRNLGVAQWGCGEYEEALKLFGELLDIAEEEKSQSLRLVATGNIGLVQSWMGNRERAMDYFMKALAIAQALKNERNISIAYELIGQTQKEMGNYREALDYFNKSLKIAIREGNRRGEAILYGSIGDLYYDQRRYALAFKYFRKALHVSADIQDRGSECLWLANIGSLHLILGEEEEGIDFLERSLQIAEDMRLQRSEKICLRQLVKAHVRLCHLPKAEALALRGMDLSLKTGDTEHQVWFLTLLGIASVKAKQTKKAISILRKGIKRADPKEHRWLLFRAKILLLRAQFLEKRSKATLDAMEKMVNSVEMDIRGAGEVESLRGEEVIAEAYLTFAKCLREMGRDTKAERYTKKAEALIEKYELYSLRREIKKYP